MKHLAIALLLVAGCRQDFAVPKPLAPLDEAYFRCRVQPVLGKSCATFACHGDGRRFYRVYNRNRLRLGGTEETRNSQLTSDERAANFDAARAYVDPSAPTESLLLKKPLEMAAGGYFHRGATLYGKGNVFANTDDPDYKTLVAWIGGATDDPACIEPGSNL